MSVLLRFNKEGPFEPLVDAPRDLLTQETLALLLLASGRRISEISNVSRSFVRRDDGVSLLWLPGFQAKWASSSFSPEHPFISKLVSSHDSDLLLCPVRAWEILLERRHEVSNPVNDESLGHCSIASLTYQFIKLVKNALRQAGLPSDIKIGPHHMRKLAASYNRSYLGGTAEWADLFQRRMGSSSLSVLESVYINEVPLWNTLV